MEIYEGNLENKKKLINNYMKIGDYNKLKGLKRYLERFGWLERSGWLECFGWLGCHCSHAALEGLNWKEIIQGIIYLLKLIRKLLMFLL